VHNSNCMEEKNESQSKTGNCVLPDELQNFKKICSSRCTICSSEILELIHKWKKEKNTHLQIVEKSKTLGHKVSDSSLSRHFSKFREFKANMATQIIKEGTIQEITLQSVHIQRTVKILDMVYDKIEKGLQSNTMRVDISDLEKLTKMRYQILNGDESNDKELMAIFQKASNKYGLDVSQGVLFK